MRSRGMAVPIALFFVLVVFCLCAVMAVEAIGNLRLTRLEADKTRHLALAYGAVERMIWRLNQDPVWETRRGEDSEEGVVVESWVERDDRFPSVLHVFARVRGGGPTVQRTVRKGPDVEGVAYAQVPGYLHGPGSVDAIFAYDNSIGQWEILPPVPRMYYDDGGNLQQPPGELAHGVPFICADVQGNVYAVCHPLWDAFLDPANPLRPIVVAFLENGLEHTDIWALYLDMHMLAELNFNFPGRRAAVLRYNRAADEWQALPPVPGYNPNGTNPPVATGNFAVTGLMAQPSCNGEFLYVANWRAGVDLLYRLELATGQWTCYPPPPNSLYEPDGSISHGPGPARLLRGVTSDGNGNLYTQWGMPGASPRTGVFHWNDQQAAWELLPPPPRTFYESATGDYVQEPGHPSNFCYMRGAPGGELFGMWWRSEGDQGHFLKFAGGVWSAVRPPIPLLPNALDADAQGRLLMKYPRVDQPDSIFRVSRGVAVELSPVPDRHFRTDGSLIEPHGFAESTMNLVGGGIPRSGGYRYLPVGSY